MRGEKKASGFTLIELLIVVAIIAILAAIAVPNFLEAQTRAKVSRVRADCRSLATAEEAYFVDWSTYTCYDLADSWDQLSGWCQLTTPVAYITSIPWDPFGAARYKGGTLKRLEALYELGTGGAGVGPSGPRLNPNAQNFPANVCVIGSMGPDHIDDTLDTTNFPGHTYAWNEATFPWATPAARGTDPVAIAEALSLLYDPTNGTISGGNILRFGGVKPAGQFFDVLFMNASGK